MPAQAGEVVRNSRQVPYSNDRRGGGMTARRSRLRVHEVRARAE
jgi:hypothetical protein